jgi:nitroreductase
MLEELIKKNRSTRRFIQSENISIETLKWLVGLARLSPSGANLQPLKYLLSNEKQKNDRIFPCLYWAGYLKDWDGPVENEKPSAYIIILNDTQISKDPGCDHGIAAQSIMLGAAEKGLSGCMIGSINRDKLQEELKIPARYHISLVLALGIANEKIILEKIGTDGSIKYYRDENNVHHVPKRSLDEIIVSF